MWAFENVLEKAGRDICPLAYALTTVQPAACKGCMTRVQTRKRLQHRENAGSALFLRFTVQDSLEMADVEIVCNYEWEMVIRTS